MEHSFFGTPPAVGRVPEPKCQRCSGRGTKSKFQVLLEEWNATAHLQHGKHSNALMHSMCLAVQGNGFQYTDDILMQNVQHSKS